MVEPITINIRHLSQDVRLPQEQVQAAIDLLDAGFPIPFIARYRKEATKNLDEETLRLIAEELRNARVLCERKQTILKTIESAGKLTSALDKSIREAKSVKRLEDIYLPFKPKKQNPAVAARESGLEPFAMEIIEGKLPPEKVDERAAEFINEGKKVKSVADVLLGAGHIIADIFACKAELAYRVRDILYQHGQLTTTKVHLADTPAPAEAKKPGGETKAEMEHSAVTENTETVEETTETVAEESLGEAQEQSPPMSPDEHVQEPEEAQEQPGGLRPTALVPLVRLTIGYL